MDVNAMHIESCTTSVPQGSACMRYTAGRRCNSAVGWHRDARCAVTHQQSERASRRTVWCGPEPSSLPLGQITDRTRCWSNEGECGRGCRRLPACSRRSCNFENACTRAHDPVVSLGTRAAGESKAKTEGATRLTLDISLTISFLIVWVVSVL